MREIKWPRKGGGIERAGALGFAYICTVRGAFVSTHDASESWGVWLTDCGWRCAANPCVRNVSIRND